MKNPRRRNTVMPIIQMNLLEGRTVEQKRNVVAAITEAVVRTLDVRPDQVRILINELGVEHFSVAGETAAMRQAAAANAKEL
ncbi:2-hydroxymuconate tautomerase [Methylibium petroleiphilum]|uniref:2-hydroxymuconate tautomerase n=1 Tax=Methylibium petroleiphilum TaxID=105560 RepID=UPI003D271011